VALPDAGALPGLAGRGLAPVQPLKLELEQAKDDKKWLIFFMKLKKAKTGKKKAKPA
jgi:hypothetical protein